MLLRRQLPRTLAGNGAASPTPQGTQEVLLKVRAAGVCHSDIHLWEGGYDLGQGRTLALKRPWRVAAADDGPRKP